MSVLGSKRSLSSVAVAGVQVDIELTAARIESAVAWREAITIQNTGYGTYSVIERYTFIQDASGQSNDVRFD